MKGERTMSAKENKALVSRYIKAISGKKKTASVVRKFVANEKLSQHIERIEAAFPCYEYIVNDMVAEGDKVAVHFTVKAVHQGEMMGIPPTGRRITIEGLIIYQIADGKIVGHTAVADELSLMQQLGIIPVA
jgi:predicted ester cyclase